MTQLNRQSTGRSITSAFVKSGFELVDNKESFVVRHKLGENVNILVYFNPYVLHAQKLVKVDVGLGLQYPEIQRLWFRLMEVEDNEPPPTWSLMTVDTCTWISKAEEDRWVYSMARDFDPGPVNSALLEAVKNYGIPYCSGYEDVRRLLEICNHDDDNPWGCDRNFVLPLVLWTVGRVADAAFQARKLLSDLENLPRKPNDAYIGNHRRFVKNLTELCR